MTFQLPEKDYFTREELSERWKCKPSLVDYYIEKGLLREAFRSSAAVFFGLQATQYYKCDKQSELFKRYCGHGDFELKIVDLLEQLGMEKPDYFGGDFVGCPEFIYNNHDPSMICEYVALDRDAYPHYISAFLYLSGIDGDRYIPAESANAGFGEMNVANLEYEETMTDYLVIPKEERDRFESLHTVSQEKEKSIRERIEDLRADRKAALGERKSDHSAHEAAEGPLPSSLKTVRESNSSNSPHCQELARKAMHESDQNTQSIGSDTSQHPWELKEPIKFQGYRKPLYELLKTAHEEGKTVPTVDDVLSAWRENKPEEIKEVHRGSIEYYSSGKQATTSANLEAIRKSIKRLLKEN